MKRNRHNHISLLKRTANSITTLGVLKTGFVETLGDATRGELGSLREHLDLVQNQIDVVESGREKVVRQGKLVADAVASDCDSDDRTSARIALLTELKGEPLHALVRAVYYGQLGRISAREVYDYMHILLVGAGDHPVDCRPGLPVRSGTCSV